nr:MAG TPA: hypothetical protein [Caudoviricetes sp.]
MKRIRIFSTGSTLISPFFIALISDSFPLILVGSVYLILLLRFTPKRWKRLFFIASVRYSKIFG